MVSRNKMSFRFFHYFYFVCFVPGHILASNYPNENEKYYPKPCSHRNVAMNYQAPICVPTEKGWETNSENTCRTGFKDQCPEFNQAECLWYAWKPSDPSLNVPELQLPCCRLKYYASTGGLSKITWMEVYYSNQYGTSDRNNTVYDIVEIHRLIKEKSAFGDNEQPDWPKNVFDPNGERGLKWVNLKNGTFVPLDGGQICPNNTDDGQVCSKKIVDFLRANYMEGFDPAKTPPKSGKENRLNATISYEHSNTCTFALIDKLKTSVCKVTYKRRSQYSYNETSANGKHTNNYGQNVTWPYLEAQVYTDPINWKDGLVRYAYLEYVDLSNLL